MITIRDVARAAGVSVATVSRVLNNPAVTSPETRERVLKATAQLGYRPNANAKALATQNSDMLGVAVMDVSDPFFGALVKGVDAVAHRYDKHLLIANSYHDAEKERDAIEMLIRQRCNALIVHAKMLSDAELGEFMRQLPGMVLINRVIAGYESRCVGLDNYAGGAMATRVLLENGHRRIGYLASRHAIEDQAERQRGYEEALLRSGIIADPAWRAAAEPDLAGGEAAMVELLGRNQRLSALFAYNDAMAAGAISALRENGIEVPAHFSIIGFDDIPIARYTSPKLTTIRYPITSMASLATELALNAAAGRLSAGAEHCFMPTLVRRWSVDRAPDDAKKIIM